MPLSFYCWFYYDITTNAPSKTAEEVHTQTEFSEISTHLKKPPETIYHRCVSTIGFCYSLLIFHDWGQNSKILSSYSVGPWNYVFGLFTPQPTSGPEATSSFAQQSLNWEHQKIKIAGAAKTFVGDGQQTVNRYYKSVDFQPLLLSVRSTCRV